MRNYSRHENKAIMTKLNVTPKVNIKCDYQVIVTACYGYVVISTTIMSYCFRSTGKDKGRGKLGYRINIYTANTHRNV